MRRTNNQDSHSVLPAKSQERFEKRGHLFIVADGMGAHAAGELASSMATEQIAMSYFRASLEDSLDSLHVAVNEANAEIYQRGQQNPEFHNMGTTASALALLREGAVVAHVGDSRVYRLRRGVLEQLTFDHSLVWEVQASGQVHPDSALGQALPKNVITRSLGPNSDVQIDIEGPFDIKVGDTFLLCSDGLTGMVDDVEIATLMDCLPEELTARVMVDLANLRGGPDNTTVVITTVADGPLIGENIKPKPRQQHPRERLFWGTTAATVAAALCLLATIVFGFLQRTGSMVIAMIGALVASSIAVSSFVNLKKQPRRKGNSDSDEPRIPKAYGGKGPYRRYLSKPDKILFDRLGKTVDELREAAKLKGWLIDWKLIDSLQSDGIQAMSKGDGKEAIHQQAKAIVETMHQLREQHNRSADETAIDN